MNLFSLSSHFSPALASAFILKRNVVLVKAPSLVLYSKKLVLVSGYHNPMVGTKVNFNINWETVILTDP